MGFASAAGAQVITAAWNANPEPDVNAYLVSYGTTSGTHPTTIVTGPVTSQQVTLTPGFIYYFVVQARNTSQLVSLKSTEASIDLTGGTNVAPTLTQPAAQSQAENTGVSLQLVASDPDSPALTYSAASLPAGVSLNASTGLFSGTLTFSSAGTYNVAATVSDGALSNTKNFTWTVTNVNQAPTLTQPVNQSQAENSSTSLQLVGSDPDGTALTYSATNLPAGASVNASTGMISGTLTFASVGTYAVAATVSDGSLTNTKNFTWTVSNVNQAPTLTQPAAQSQAENTSASLQLAGSDPDATALTYSATNLPAGASLNAATGLVSGMLTLASSGTYDVAATVSDGSLTDTKNFTWTVTNVNQAPTLTQPAAQSQAENTSASLQLVGSDPDATALTYSATNLPAGASLNAATGLVSGMLTSSSSGTYDVAATVSDGSLSNTKNFTWTVTDVSQAPTLTQPMDQASAENATISLALEAGDPDGTALTFSASGLPASLSINLTTGVIGGTLTFTSAGTYTVTATVSDGALTDSKTFSWDVTDVVQAAPTITSAAPTSGPVGTAVTITGTNFGASQGSSSVTFNGTVAAPTTWSATSIIVPVPTGATSGNIVVTVDGAASNGADFTVSASAAITLVQHQSKDGGTTRSLSLAFNANNAPGNFIAVVIRAGGTGRTPTVTDVRGNTYRQAVRFNGVKDTGAIYYAENIGGGANTVTVSIPVTVNLRFAILEYAGVATSNSLDGVVMAQGNSRSANSGNLTTTTAGDLLLGAITTPGDVNVVAGVGYTIQESVPALPAAKLIVEDRTLSTVGTASASGTLSVARKWAAALAAFKAASSGTASAAIIGVTSVNDGVALKVSRSVLPARPDYDGDSKADITVFAPSTGTWSILESTTGAAMTANLGAVGDRPVSGDFDGDGKIDIAVYRSTTGEWTALLSSSNYLTSLTVSLGIGADIPVPGDYDGDGVTDIAVYQPATRQWQILKSSTHYATNIVTVWGARGDIPVPGDYDGDSMTDLAVYRPGTAEWRVLLSSTGYATNLTIAWGQRGDVPVPADYDGDGRTDVAMYRPSSGAWNVLQSSSNFSTSVAVSWGGFGDVPVPDDYDGDGKADVGVFQSGVWQIRLSKMNDATGMRLSWGTSGDVPVPNIP